MLKLNLQRNFATLGISRPYTYLVRQGFSKNFSIRLSAGDIQRIDLAVIEKLCVLFRCTPNDLLEWVPAAGEQGIETSPLAALIRSGANVNMLDALNALPYDKLAEVEKLISERVKKK
jgi:DNA-binding Xre family transcriptional regulator